MVEFRAPCGLQADALLIATPEYNSSVSGALKNGIDWASRSPQQPLNGKPVAIMGASTGNFGTLRAQLHLRQILTHVGALPLGKPEVLVARAEQAFDPVGNLTDARGAWLPARSARRPGEMDTARVPDLTAHDP